MGAPVLVLLASKSESNSASSLASLLVQLIETSVAPLLFAQLTALRRLAKLMFSASTRRMVAPGASAWAHSMSSDSSSVQSGLVPGVPWGSTWAKHAPVVAGNGGLDVHEARV